jgi:hypothetical protein
MNSKQAVIHGWRGFKHMLSINLLQTPIKSLRVFAVKKINRSFKHYKKFINKSSLCRDDLFLCLARREPLGPVYFGEAF